MPNIIVKTFKSWHKFEKRFMTNIRKECFLPENKDLCWDWQGHKSGRGKGYGEISWANKSYRAHRVSYLIFNGEIPYNQIVLHKCDNPICVNPTHLILGTHSDNCLDAVNKNRHSQQKLNSEAVKVIKWMIKYKYKRGLIDKLAKLHKVHPSTISSINSGQSWTYIKV